VPPSTRTKVPRCAYVERNQRCRRKGAGSPPLCDAHRIVIDEAARTARPGEKFVGLLGRFFRGQKISDDHLYAGIEDVVDMFSRPPSGPTQNPIDAARARAQDFFRRAQQQGAAPARPRKPPGPDPRVVLGFAAGQRVTADDVKKRHRELALKFHPDKRGGSTKQMAEINDAVDRLLRDL
jgi:hypothetical protein